MTSLKIIAIIGIIIFGATACSTIRTTAVTDLNSTPNGIRVYPPRVLLMVHTTAKKSRLVYAPDLSRAYDIKPLTVLAKQDFKIELDEGQVKTLTANQDTTAFLTFLQGAAELASKAAGVAVSSTSIEGTFGLKDGIYVMKNDGSFERVQTDCALPRPDQSKAVE